MFRADRESPDLEPQTEPEIVQAFFLVKIRFGAVRQMRDPVRLGRVQAPPTEQCRNPRKAPAKRGIERFGLF